MKKIVANLLAVFLAAPIVAMPPASAFWERGATKQCDDALSSLSFLERISLRKREHDLPPMVFLDKLSPDSLGKRVIVRPVDINASGEIHFMTDNIRKSVLIGCDGIEGRISAINKFSLTLKLDNGELKSIPESDDQIVEILVQPLE